jgi:hypothetical protein
VGLRASEDPTVHGARLFPQALEEAHGWGVEPGGGVRAIVAGVRLISMPGGSMLVASDRLPATPSAVLTMPERLGGGFLFTVGAHLWRADAWLAPATPLYTSSLPIAQVLVGLDRVYLRSPQGSLVALDPRTGVRIQAGPLPASPNIGRLAAPDAWRAVVIADLRGALLTVDAGSTWRPLALPVEPSEVVTMGDAVVVGGQDEGRQMQWWEVRSEGDVVKLSFPPAGTSPNRIATPTENASPSSTFPPEADRARIIGLRTFGPHPLVAAVEDGWPLTDGTALVARDGALARVKLSDGALVEIIGDAFPLKPARCHAMSLGSSPASGAVGFACGEPRGRTAVYRFDPVAARLVELRAFGSPRQVVSFGTGAVAVRGSCAWDGVGEPTDREESWCAMRVGGTWTQTRLPSGERLVILADGRAVHLRPPLVGDLSSLQLTIEDGAQRSERIVTLPPLHADVEQALRLGLWLDGFEERRPGTIGGWVDAAGAVIGIEISTNGDARVGEYIRDAGGPVPSGRWAFGCTASRRGFETTDGGMTWTKEVALPDPIAPGRGAEERACGPIGCLAAGWVRLGWGGVEQPVVPEPRPYVGPPTHATPRLEFECEPMSGPGPLSGSASVVRVNIASGIPNRARGAVTALPAFAGYGGPLVPPDDMGLSVEVSHALERGLRGAPLGRIYAWGPKTGEWDQLGRWQVRWQWPWGGGPDARSSAAALVPWTNFDGVRRALSVGPGASMSWIIAPGDDADHALLLGRHATNPTTVGLFVLETDRPVVEVHRPNGEPFPDVEAATRIGGVWYVATAQGAGELAATILWSVEGAMAREMTRVPRAGFEVRPALRLARRADGHGLGLVVDSQRDELRALSERWLGAVDLESNAVATPEPLAPVDLSDRAVSLCTGDDDGWVVDLPYPGAIRIHMGSGWESQLDGSFARMRLSREKACIERVEGLAADRPPGLTGSLTTSLVARRASVADTRSIEASVVTSGSRYALRCVRK